MISESQARELMGATAYDEDGDKIGKVGQVYCDDDTGRPEWVAVNTGLFGTSESFVPLSEATFDGGDLRVPYPKSKVKDAPQIEATGHLEPSEEDDLYRYYDIETGGGTRTAGDRTTVTDRGRTDDNAMTRSEEELRVGTETRAAGKARLRKYVTTEEQTVTVPVKREEVRVEREPITDENVDEAMDGPEITESEHEVTVHEEVPVVGTETRPKERVRLQTEEVTETEQVSGQVRKEHIDVDQDTEQRNRT
jgi:uncharacterized protein (TIGR02271 family)